ncbi:MAG: hypothetical protein AB9834_00380 [Lentimicrobium sp.]
MKPNKISIGLIASIITIFAFLTGIDKCSKLFKRNPGQEKSISTINDKKDISIELGSTGFLSFNKHYNVYIKTNGERNAILKLDTPIWNLTISPDSLKFAVIQYNTIHVQDINGNNHQYYTVLGTPSYKFMVKNLVWVSKHHLRAFLGNIECEGSFLIETFDLPCASTYDLYIDSINTLIKIEPLYKK